MGMVDTFYGTYKCPECGKEVMFEEQTKDFECGLMEYKLGDYVDKANINGFYDFKYECPYCKEETNLSIGIKTGQYVGVYYTSVARKMCIEDLKSIEEGYQRKREYEEKCRNMLGDENLGRIDSDIIDLKTGETINALGTDWEVLEAYKEEYADVPKSQREEALKRFFYFPSFVYRVKAGDIYRIIRLSLNPNMLTLSNDVFEDGFDQLNETKEGNKTYKYKYHLQSRCRLVKLDDNEDNKITLT